jgi:hypothetical protein
MGNTHTSHATTPPKHHVDAATPPKHHVDAAATPPKHHVDAATAATTVRCTALGRQNGCGYIPEISSQYAGCSKDIQNRMIDNALPCVHTYCPDEPSVGSLMVCMEGKLATLRDDSTTTSPAPSTHGA